MQINYDQNIHNILLILLTLTKWLLVLLLAGLFLKSFWRRISLTYNEMERVTRLELATSTLARLHSTN